MPSENINQLYELYIASLVNTSATDFCKALPNEMLPEYTCLSFDTDIVSSFNYLGSIVVVETASHEVWSLIWKLEASGQYKAYKVSTFTGFASEYDILIRAGSSKYLLQTDNCYYLHECEVRNAFVITTLNPGLIDRIEEALDHLPLSELKGSTDLGDPKNLFRIMEHEISLELRCRNPEKPLWLPQIALQYARDPDAALPRAAADNGIDEAFRVLCAQQDDRTFYAREFTLFKNESYDLVLIPDSEFISRKAEILCGDLVVYRGKLPRELTLACYVTIPVAKAQSFLQVSLRLLKD